jgi:hypothetical protein
MGHLMNWITMLWMTMMMMSVVVVEGGNGGRVIGIPFGCGTGGRTMPFCFRRSLAGEDGAIAS